MQRPLTAFHYRISTSFLQGIVEDILNLRARTCKRVSQDRHKRICCCLQDLDTNTSKSHQNNPEQLSHKRICKLLVQGPSKGISARSSAEDLVRILKGPLLERHQNFHENVFMRQEIKGKKGAPKSRGRLCGRLHSRNAHGHRRRASMSALTGKLPGTKWSTGSSTGLHSYLKNPEVCARCMRGGKPCQPLFNKACPSDSPAFMAVPIHVAVQELKTSLRVAGVTALCGEDLAYDEFEDFCGLTRDLALWHHTSHFFINTLRDPPRHSLSC